MGLYYWTKEQTITAQFIMSGETPNQVTIDTIRPPLTNRESGAFAEALSALSELIENATTLRELLDGFIPVATTYGDMYARGADSPVTLGSIATILTTLNQNLAQSYRENGANANVSTQVAEACRLLDAHKYYRLSQALKRLAEKGYIPAVESAN